MRVPSPCSSTGDTEKMSTLMKPDFRNFSVCASCSVSWLTNGTAVFAAAKRCEWTVPSAWRPGSADFTGVMWQSTQVCPFGG